MSSHERSLSNESALTSLPSDEEVVRNADASFSSDASHISTRSEEFINDVKDIIDGPTPLGDLMIRAQKLVAKLSSSEEFNKLPPGSPQTNLKLDRVLTAMLSHAFDCGGENSKRYTASAICACGSKDDNTTLLYLQSLGSTWVSHLLFVCK